MAKTLGEIQDHVRYLLEDDSVIIVSGYGLENTNTIYRSLCSKFPWKELRRVDTSLGTTDGTGDYQFPTSPVFTSILSIEVLSTKPDVAKFDEAIFGFDEFHDDPEENSFKFVAPAPNEWEWNIQGKLAKTATPKLYKCYHNGTNSRIEFRPPPNETIANAIRITGIIEPTALTNKDSTTVFMKKDVDDALGLMIAADIGVIKKTATELHKFYLEKAQSILETLSIEN